MLCCLHCLFSVILILTTLMSIMQANWGLIDSDSNLIRSYCRDFHRPFANHPATNHTHLRSSFTMTPLNWTRDNSETVLTVCLCLCLTDCLASCLGWLSVSQVSVGRLSNKSVCWSLKCRSVSLQTSLSVGLSSVGRSVGKQVCLLVSQVLVGQLANKSVCWFLKCRSVGWQTSLFVGLSSVGWSVVKQVCLLVSQVSVGQVANKSVCWSLKCRSVSW